MFLERHEEFRSMNEILREKNEALESENKALREELEEEQSAALSFEGKVLDYLTEKLGSREKASEELDKIVFGSEKAYEADKALRMGGSPEEALARAIVGDEREEERYE